MATPPPSNTIVDVIAGTLRNQEARHVAVARRIHDDILAGRWPVGSQMPPEQDLETLYGISRYGVRRAVDLLISLGLVSRKQGVGTCVLATEPKQPYSQTVTDLDDLVQYVKGTRTVHLSKESVVPSGELMQELNADGKHKWLRLVMMRFAGDSGPPIAFSQIYINPIYARLPDLNKLDMPIYTKIEKHYGVRITRVEQVITAAMISGEQAKLLQLSKPDAGLRIVRKYFVGAVLADVTIALHPSTRYSYSTVFELGSAN